MLSLVLCVVGFSASCDLGAVTLGNYTLDLLILELLLFSFILILCLIVVLFRFRLGLWLRSRSDYKRARGTVHRRFLELWQPKITRELAETKEEVKTTKQQKDLLLRRKAQEFEAAAAIYLIDLDFPISSLKEKVILCFDGSLRSLNQCANVPEVSVQQAQAVAEWVKTAEKKLPSITVLPFPGKIEIEKKFEPLEKEANHRITELEKSVRELQKMIDLCSSHLKKLQSVSASTFFKSYMGDPQTAAAASDYLLGVFPPWEEIPEWFKTLLKRYEPN